MINKKRIASIDYGLKRIGIAISDENRMIATSLTTIETGKSREETAHKILNSLAPYDLERIIIGNPLHLNGQKSLLTDEVHYFLALLQNQVNCPVSLFDERLTSRQAERSLQERGLSRKKRAQCIDALSAVIILQSYLGY